jgi:hypothetical protein
VLSFLELGFLPNLRPVLLTNVFIYFNDERTFSIEAVYSVMAGA